MQQVFAQLQQASMEQERLRKRVSALEASEAVRRAGREARMPVEFRSQYGEDAFLWDFFGGQLEGFFIEVGAFDGYHFSVSYAFECIGWEGLLVEAIPERHAECVKRRPHSRVVHAALSRRGSSGTAEFTVTEDPLGGMFSYFQPDPSHVESEWVKAAKRRTVKVPLMTMNELLADRTREIDFAVIDVEGNELLLLDGFDLSKHRPKMMMIEDNRISKGGNPELGRLMEQSAYKEVARLAVNRVFVRDDVLPEWMRRRTL
jgi:FkbM family methyltransferase